MATDESDNENFFSDEDEDKEAHLVEMSCAKIIDLDKMPNFSWKNTD